MEISKPSASLTFSTSLDDVIEEPPISTPVPTTTTTETTTTTTLVATPSSSTKKSDFVGKNMIFSILRNPLIQDACAFFVVFMFFKLPSVLDYIKIYAPHLISDDIKGILSFSAIATLIFVILKKASLSI
jgi:hypothetical protein